MISLLSLFFLSLSAQYMTCLMYDSHRGPLVARHRLSRPLSSHAFKHISSVPLRRVEQSGPCGVSCVSCASPSKQSFSSLSTSSPSPSTEKDEKDERRMHHETSSSSVPLSSSDGHVEDLHMPLGASKEVSVSTPRGQSGGHVLSYCTGCGAAVQSENPRVPGRLMHTSE